MHVDAHNDLCRHHLDYAKSAKSAVPGLVLSTQRFIAGTRWPAKSPQAATNSNELDTVGMLCLLCAGCTFIL